MKGKVPFILCLLPFFGALSQEIPNVQASLVLQNGDRLTGELISSTERTFIFSSYWSEDLFEIPVSEVQKYERPAKFENAVQEGVRVFFHHGGYLTVLSIELNDGVFKAESSWGEMVFIPAASVSSLKFFHSEKILYQGPKALESETVRIEGKRSLTPQVRQWTSIPVNYPDSFLLEMELNTRSPEFTYQLQLFHSLDQRTPGRVTLEVSEEMISGSSFQQTPQNRINVKNWRKPLPGKKTQHRFQLFGDTQKNIFTLYVNHQKIHTWENEPIGLMIGSRPLPITIRYLLGEEALELTNVRLFEWNTDSYTRGEVSENFEKDTVISSGTPKQTGDLLSLNLEEPGAVLQTEDDLTLRIPLSRLFEIFLGRGSRQKNSLGSSEFVLLETGGYADRLFLSSVLLKDGYLEATLLYGEVSTGIRISLDKVYRLSFPKQLP